MLYAADAHYKVLPGRLHRKGKVIIRVLPDTDKYKVQMDFDVKRKDFVPVPAKLLKGATIMEFPNEFRTEAGYLNLVKNKTLEIPKAHLVFVKRLDDGHLKGAYLLEVHPKNKKSKIDIVYHPSLPAVGWKKVKITFISKIPILGGYQLEAELTQ